jgi:hypothetical protein
MTTIATSAVHDALSRAANHLMSAAGLDGVVSKKDIYDKVISLRRSDEVTHNEAEIVSELYNFVKSRDTARSVRVTKSTIDSALTHLRAELDRLDLDKNGFSPDEAQRMPWLGRIAVAVARHLNPPPLRAIEPGSADVSDLRGEALAKHLASLTKHLGFGYFGESESPFEPFHVAANLSQLTPDTFRATLGLTDGPLQKITNFEPGDQYMQRLDESDGVRAEDLVRGLKANLRDISTVLLGPYDDDIVEYPAYVVGIDAAGNLVGLKSVAIRT